MSSSKINISRLRGFQASAYAAIRVPPLVFDIIPPVAQGRRAVPELQATALSSSGRRFSPEGTAGRGFSGAGRRRARSCWRLSGRSSGQLAVDRGSDSEPVEEPPGDLRGGE